LHTVEDLANWQPYIEDPLTTNYKGIDVYKLQQWVQGPVLLQALNLLEDIDLKAMGHNSAEYIHTLYQVMNLAYADRDFYYGDPYYPPEEPMEGLLSKEYAADRRELIDYEKNDPNIGPGDPYPYQGEENPFKDILEEHYETYIETKGSAFLKDDWHMGTTSIQAADAKGWIVSVTPSGGWLPAVIAGKTGIQMSQRMQSFVVDPVMNPFNVVEPGKRPRATLTPSLALKDGRPYMSFSLPGGDFQDQALLQLFLNVVEFGLNVQEACEAPKFRSYQMLGSFGSHSRNPGRILLDARIPEEVVEELRTMGYDVEIATPGGTERPGGEYPGSLTAIYFDQDHGTLLGGASIQLERYGIAW
jgi:gamma-glutamyltranspeptidase/glutathione hydrolase